MPLQTLRPRIATLQPRTARTVTVERIRGRELQAIRAAHFRDHPLCVRCEDAGIVRVGTIVDHIVALENGGADAPGNRQTLCVLCHDLKTIDDNRQARGA